LRKTAAGSWFRFVEKGGKRPKVPVHHRVQHSGHARFLAVAVGEGRVEEGSRTAVPSELTLLEQGLPALEACDDNVP